VSLDHPVERRARDVEAAVGRVDDPATINVASGEPFIRSLNRLGFVSLDPAIARGL